MKGLVVGLHTGYLKVLLTTANVLGLANWGTFMLEASGTASSGGVGRHFQQERSRGSIYKMVE